MTKYTYEWYDENSGIIEENEDYGIIKDGQVMAPEDVCIALNAHDDLLAADSELAALLKSAQAINPNVIGIAHGIWKNGNMNITIFLNGFNRVVARDRCTFAEMSAKVLHDLADFEASP